MRAVSFVLCIILGLTACGSKLRSSFPASDPAAFQNAQIGAEIDIGAARFDFETNEDSMVDTRFQSSKVSASYSKNHITYPKPNAARTNLGLLTGLPDPNFQKARAPRERTSLEALLAPHQTRPITIFVHGFNNSFDTALNQVSDFAMSVRASQDPDTSDHPMRNDIILISWPERELNNPLDILPFIASIRQYSNAQETVLTVRSEVKDSLYQIAALHKGEINLVAHSMGSVLLLETLRDMAKENRIDMGNRFRSLYLYNADIPVSALSSYLNDIGIRNLPRDRRIVASGDDEVLSLSENLSGNARVGKITSDPDAMKFFGCVYQFAFFESRANQFDALGHAPKLGTRHRALTDRELAGCQKNIENALLAKLNYVDTAPGQNELEVVAAATAPVELTGAPEIPEDPVAETPNFEAPADLPPETGQIDEPVVIETPTSVPNIVPEDSDSPYLAAAEALLEQKAQGQAVCTILQIETGEIEDCVIIEEKVAN